MSAEKDRLSKLWDLFVRVREAQVALQSNSVRIGWLLLEQKRRQGLRHRAWRAWVQKSMPFSLKEATRYVRLCMRSEHDWLRGREDGHKELRE